VSITPTRDTVPFRCESCNLRTPKQLCVDRNDDCTNGHKHGPDRRRKDDAPVREHAGRERNSDDVIPGRLGEVLDHFAVARLREVDHAGHIAGITAHQYDVPCFDCYFSSGTDSNPDIRSD
jgi:hypothetical protein